MWRWFAKARPPEEASGGSSALARDSSRLRPVVPAARHRLFLLATALVARGMRPDQAYKTALHYIEGPGRGRTWMSALAEEDARRASRSVSVAALDALTGRLSTNATSSPVLEKSGASITGPSAERVPARSGEDSSVNGH
jgi:hypothetical protein